MIIWTILQYLLLEHTNNKIYNYHNNSRDTGFYQKFNKTCLFVFCNEHALQRKKTTVIHAQRYFGAVIQSPGARLQQLQFVSGNMINII